MNGILGSKIPDTHFTLYLFLTLQKISLLFIIGIIFGCIFWHVDGTIFLSLEKLCLFQYSTVIRLEPPQTHRLKL